MLMHNATPVGLLSALLLLSACSDNSDADARQAALLEGLWYLEGNLPGAYFELAMTEGKINLYELSDTDNCYFGESIALEKIGENHYALGNNGLESDITATADMLTIAFVDVDDDDEDGDVTEIITERFQRVSGLLAEDLPLCSE